MEMYIMLYIMYTSVVLKPVESKNVQKVLDFSNLDFFKAIFKYFIYREVFKHQNHLKGL